MLGDMSTAFSTSFGKMFLACRYVLNGEKKKKKKKEKRKKKKEMTCD